MAKRPNLAASLAATDEADTPAVAAQTPEIQPKAKKAKPAPANRDETALIQAHFPKHVRFALEDLKLKRSRETNRRVDLKDLMAEAFNDIFKKYGMPEVAPTKD